MWSGSELPLESMSLSVQVLAVAGHGTPFMDLAAQLFRGDTSGMVPPSNVARRQQFLRIDLLGTLMLLRHATSAWAHARCN